tara:strand:- start:1916 stop:2257 length:342 start_codon:yes stop_codon:yes gene_type:complete
MNSVWNVIGIDQDGVTMSGVYSSKEKAIEEINVYFFDKLVKLGAEFKGNFDEFKDNLNDFTEYMNDDYVVMQVADKPYHHWADKWRVPNTAAMGDLMSEKVHIERMTMDSHRC